MDLYRVPKNETRVRILLDDGRTLEGSVYTSPAGPMGLPETILDRLADLSEEFLPLACGDDPMMLPGAVKYGGLPAFAALCAPGELFLHNHAGTSSGKITKAAYAASGAEGNLKRQPRPAKPHQTPTPPARAPRT